LCPHRCEAACNRQRLDEPLAINAIERAVGDFALAHGLPLQAASAESPAERVGVVGSGAAGLSCAYQLARRGYRVTLVDAPRDRLRLDYSGKQARIPVGGLQPPAGAYDGDWRVNEPAVIDRVITEATRCMSCGQCFECDNCWECCSDQAVVKPSARGEPYRFRLELCPGCGACAEECPSGYIDMR
jgi:Pyruvate/2-oxoacid:ferredoxin oxidoreductase delta subunit